MLVKEVSETLLLEISKTDNRCFVEMSQHFTFKQDPATKYYTLEDNDGLAFVLVYFSGLQQIGFWMSPNLRGHGKASMFLQATLAKMISADIKMLLAITDVSHKTSQKILLNNSFKRMAKTNAKYIYSRYI